MKKFGDDIQNNIYQTMVNPDPKRLPVKFEKWKERARELLEDGPYDYIAGGAGAEHTMKDNLEAFQRWRIIPRMLREVEERDLSVELLGEMYDFPIMQAPIGVQSIIHPDGEVASAKASAKLGVPYIASSASTIPMEKVAEAMGDAPRWFQLY
ncbi:MAG TPA: alpha-hydroxy-acid oxidizing protein, partial [Virgibacillus sp.]|nr:alpha-hydroxy-acid oxidizing protein [Virgibacillus sp.]